MTPLSENGGNAARDAKARAEVAQLAIRAKTRKRLLRRWSRDGAFAMRKEIRRAGQVVIPADILERWSGSTATPIEILILDLEWGVLIIPVSEASSFVADLGVEEAMLMRRRQERD